MVKPNKDDIETIMRRSQPEHTRKEDRTKFDHTLRKPKVEIRRKKRKLFEFKQKGFSLLDVSKNGACVLTDTADKSPYSVNEEIIIEFPNGVERIATVRWFIVNMDVEGHELPQLAIGIQLNKPLTGDELLSI